MCVRACVCARACACLLACECESVCQYECVSVFERLRERKARCMWVRACVRACVRVCACVGFFCVKEMLPRSMDFTVDKQRFVCRAVRFVAFTSNQRLRKPGLARSHTRHVLKSGPVPVASCCFLLLIRCISSLRKDISVYPHKK